MNLGYSGVHIIHPERARKQHNQAKRQYQWSDPRMGPIQKSQNTSATDSLLQLRGSSALWFMRAAPALKLFRLTSLRCDMHFGSKESRALIFKSIDEGLELFFWGYRCGHYHAHTDTY